VPLRSAPRLLGTAGWHRPDRARRRLQRRLGSHPSTALPCFRLARPGRSPALGPRWDLFPIRLMESSGLRWHCPGERGHVLYRRAGAAPGMGTAPGGDRETPGVARGAAQLQSLRLLHHWSHPVNWFNWEPPWEEAGPGWELRRPTSGRGGRWSLPTAMHRAGAAAVAA